MVELKDPQQKETDGKLQFHSRLMLIERMFASLKAHNLKVRVGDLLYYSGSEQEIFFLVCVFQFYINNE